MPTDQPMPMPISPMFAQDACVAAADALDGLAPDSMTAEECVAVIARLTKGTDSLQAIIKSTVGLLEMRLAELVPPRTAAAVGGYTVRSKPGSPKRTNWDSEGLLRAVLDSRRFTPTGTLIEETQADKLMHVFGFSGSSAKITALRDRGLDPDDFCEVTREDKVEVL